MRLRELRNLKGLSRKELAENIGVSVNSIDKYENGKAEPSIDKLIKLAKLFNVSVDTLIGNDAEIIDLTALDDNRQYIVKKIVKELDDIAVAKIIGYMDK